MNTSHRLNEIPPSGTIAISNLVSKLRAEGKDVISFSLGEPDFSTPENIVDACVESLRSGFTHYTPSMGIPELRKAIAESTKAKNGIPCDASNVLVTPTKQALFMIALAYLDPGDEVLLPDPSWVSYEAHIRMCGAVPKYISTSFDDGFVIDPDNVAKAVTPKTKMMVINSPSNPTGCVQPEATLKGIADICKDNDIVVLSDEIYENIIYEGKHHSIAAMPDMFERTITVSGLSKTYAMTGWRLGWAIAPEADIKAINKLQSHSVTCCASFTQPAAIEAIRGQQEDKERMVATFKKRRDLALDLIEEIPGLECSVPGGAFYLFPRYSARIPSMDLAEKLLRDGHVGVTPGRAFGPCGEGFFRFSYAASEEDIVEGLSRIKKVLSNL
ncbi:MAG: pyridoxal phosphate-dependent aminotransferase [Candidatus Methanomethylophilaceae archaeon]